jgi:hAT family C-terminal dimerisation region
MAIRAVRILWDVDTRWNIISKTNDTPSPSTPTTTSTEIQLYKSSVANHTNINLDDENFSILQYLHQVKGVFPILSSRALDIFSVFVSTVASESCFSAANRVLTDKRTRLGLDVFEALVLLKDWYDAEKRLQDKSWMHAIDNESSSANPDIPDSPDPEPSQQDPYASNPYM